MMNKEIYPGEVIGTVEEFLLGNGTYEKDNKIYAYVRGNLVINNGEASIETNKIAKRLEKGVIIQGRVERATDSLVMLLFRPINDKGIRYCRTTDYAVLHASKVSRGYIKNIRDYIKVGDIIKAKIIDYDPRTGSIDLAMDNPGLGIIKAYHKTRRSLPTGDSNSSRRPSNDRNKFNKNDNYNKKSDNKTYKKKE